MEAAMALSAHLKSCKPQGVQSTYPDTRVPRGWLAKAALSCFERLTSLPGLSPFEPPVFSLSFLFSFSVNRKASPLYVGA